MLDKVLDVANLIYQIADFLVKGLVSYSQTEQGSKEWADVQAALVEVGALAFEAPAEADKQAAPSPSGTPLQEWTPAQVEAWFDQQQAQNADAQREVTRAPRQHEAHKETPSNV